MAELSKQRRSSPSLLKPLDDSELRRSRREREQSAIQTPHHSTGAAAAPPPRTSAPWGVNGRVHRDIPLHWALISVTCTRSGWQARRGQHVSFFVVDYYHLKTSFRPVIYGARYLVHGDVSTFLKWCEVFSGCAWFSFTELQTLDGNCDILT